MKLIWVLVALLSLVTDPSQRDSHLYRIEVIGSDVESVEFTLSYLIRDEVITIDKSGKKEYFSMKKELPLHFKIYLEEFEYDKMKIFLFTEKGSMSEVEIYRPYGREELTELHPKMLLEYRFETDRSIEVKNLPDRYIYWENALEESLKYRGSIEPSKDFSLILYDDTKFEINAELIVYLPKGTYTQIDYDLENGGFIFPLAVYRQGFRILFRTDLLYYQIGTFQMNFHFEEGYFPAEAIWIPSSCQKRQCKFMLRLYLDHQYVILRKKLYFKSSISSIQIGSSETLDSYSSERVVL